MKSFREFRDEFTWVEAYELVDYLSERLGNRFSFSEKLSDDIGPYATCYLDSKEFEIEFYDRRYLILNTKPENKEIFDELIPIFNEVMGSQPICSYDLLKEGEELKDALPTIEWNVEDPNKRITDIVYGIGYRKSYRNLKLHNGKEIADYIEGPNDPADECLVEESTELDLYVAISVMDYFIENIKASVNARVIPGLGLTEFEKIREYLVYQTTRFGVELDTPGNNSAIRIRARFLPDFINWYAYYDNYYRNVLTDEERQAYGNAKKLREDTSSFMPEKNWAAAKESTSKILKKNK